MPRPSPALSPADAEKLVELGGEIRKARKTLGLTAVATAEAAGMSRVTLHRIERGEPSVTMGAYLAAASALGLKLSVVGASAEDDGGQDELVALGEYPELRRLAWHLPGAETIPAREALEIYERNWKHVDEEAMPPKERELLAHLTQRYGRGRKLV